MRGAIKLSQDSSADPAPAVTPPSPGSLLSKPSDKQGIQLASVGQNTADQPSPPNWQFLPDALASPTVDSIRRHEAVLRRALKAFRDTKDRPSGAPFIPYKTCPREEREQLFKWRPILEEHDGLRALAQYLLHAGFRAENGGHLADVKTLFRQFGLKPYRSGERPRGRTLLWLYKLFVDKNLTWSKSHSNGRARTITQHGVPSHIRNIRDAHLESPKDFQEVFFMTRTKPNRTSKGRLRGANKPVETPSVPPPPVAETAKLYLNDRNERLFSSMKKKIPEVRSRLKTGLFDVPRKEHQRILQRLKDIENWPKPRYEHSVDSPRLRSVGTNQIVSLDCEIRQALYGPNHIELDLSKAHAAIAARDWGGLENLNSWLEKQLNGELDFWPALATTILSGTNLTNEEAAKKAVKRGLYTTVYGGRKDTILFEISKTYGEETVNYPSYDQVEDNYPSYDQVEGFLKHPMIAELLEARDKRLERIRTEGELVDCFGRAVLTENFAHEDNPERVVLAYTAQARELDLLYPVFKMAIAEEKAVENGQKQRPDFQVLLYQYDGVTIQVGRKERWQAVVKKLIEAVNTKAIEEGYITSLEVEWSPDAIKAEITESPGEIEGENPRNRRRTERSPRHEETERKKNHSPERRGDDGDSFGRRE